jgi:ComF family protein
LCRECTEVFARPVPRCARCGLRTGIAVDACGECLSDAPPFERTCCVADYGFPWDRLISAFKFEARTELVSMLAERLHQAVLAAGGPAADWVLPVPLSAQRLAERGYNQAWELARRVAHLAGLPAAADLLQRPLDHAHQASLDRTQRQKNLHRAFMVDPRRRERLQGRRVALVDDVMTTGTTVREASATLLRAGAASVQVWVLARTPAD